MTKPFFPSEKLKSDTPEKTGMRIVSISPDLTGKSVHSGLFMQAERALHEAARSLGIDYVVIGGPDVEQPSDFEGRIVPSRLRSTGYHLESSEWIAFWGSRESDDTCAHILEAFKPIEAADSTERDTVFLLYHGHPCHVSGLIWLGLALGGRHPIVINLYWLHFVYGPNRPRRIPWLKTFLEATRSLRRTANVHLCVDSQRLADLLFQDTGENMPVLPFFSPMGVRKAPVKTATNSANVKIVYPTAVPNREKGFDLVVGLAERLGRCDVEIIARETDAAMNEVCLPTTQALAGGLHMVKSFMPEAGYQAMLSSADIVLVPYAAWQFDTRTSGVVADAITLGIPMVGTRGCWIGDQIEQVRGGETFEDGNLDSFVSAVRNVLNNHAKYAAELAINSTRWASENSSRALVEYLSNFAAKASPIKLSRSKRVFGRLRLAALTRIYLPTLRIWSTWAALSFYTPKQIIAGRSGQLKLQKVEGIREKRGWIRVPVITWTTHGVDEVELRLDAPDGFLISSGPGRGAVWPTFWIRPGQRIFLQDVTGGRPLRPGHTLDIRRFRLLSNSIADRPASFSVLRRFLVHCIRRVLRLGVGTVELSLPSNWSGSPSQARVSWRFSGSSSAQLELRVNGNLFARQQGAGVLETPNWVVKGLTFDLYDARSNVPNFLRYLDSAKANRTKFDEVSRSIGHEGSCRHFQNLFKIKENILESNFQRPSSRENNLDTARFNVGRDEWAVIVPPSTGEIYIIAAHSRTFLSKYGGVKLVLFAPTPHLDILKLFPDAPVRGEPRAADDLGELRSTRRVGTAIRLDYGVGVTMNDDGDRVLIGRHEQQSSGFAQLFLEEVAIRVGEGMIQAHAPETVRKSTRRAMRELLLIEARTVILCPAANSMPSPGLDAWTHIAEVLMQRGFCVASNCGPGEHPIPGTVPWTRPLSELFTATELGGYTISARNGLCDMLSAANTKLHILHQDYTLVPFPGIDLQPSLSANGLPDKAVYHVMGLDEGHLDFAERVLAHPDFVGPSEGSDLAADS
jgi:glycosyltransferase involved in cell wall biosynthesis